MFHIIKILERQLGSGDRTETILFFILTFVKQMKYFTSMNGEYYPMLGLCIRTENVAFECKVHISNVQL